MKILKRIRKIYHEDGNFIGYKINRHGELVIDKIYQSIDGKEFDSEYECKNYEKRIKLIKKLKKNIWYCLHKWRSSFRINNGRIECYVGKR